ncbi:hypothetical protein [Halomonas sp. NO4]|uniref:hypothetical protein n=1 Tax=Halomonas sp. NO4 TaxID=2484813 RepID=UPI0013D539B0|nr:hypothetical protein [Halomonas sp. NO4]
MHRLMTVAAVTLALLAGCTTYTWEDGRRETVWGVPAEEEVKRHEDDRQGDPVEYRVPGEIPE